MSIMLKEKRPTRGSRMTDLIGEAAEQDQQFWGDSVWNEDSEDDSFDEAEAEAEDKPDEFDSDFNDSEDDDEEDSENEEDKKRIQKKPVSSNKYKEPPQSKAKRPPQTAGSDAEDDPPRQRAKKVQSFDAASFSTERAVRTSTKTRTEFSNIIRKQEVSRPKVVYRKPIKHQFAQKELLLEALQTEVTNEKWLRTQKLAEDERVASEKPTKSTSAHYIRFISKRGAYNTITFSDVDLMPKVFSSNSSSKEVYDEDNDDDF